MTGLLIGEVRVTNTSKCPSPLDSVVELPVPC